MLKMCNSIRLHLRISFCTLSSERLKWGEIAPQCLTVTKMISYMRMKAL